MGTGYSNEERLSETILISDDEVAASFWDDDARLDFRGIADGYRGLLTQRIKNAAKTKEVQS